LQSPKSVAVIGPVDEKSEYLDWFSPCENDDIVFREQAMR
jgi:hypothetical protein